MKKALLVATLVISCIIAVIIINQENYVIDRAFSCQNFDSHSRKIISETKNFSILEEATVGIKFRKLAGEGTIHIQRTSPDSEKYTTSMSYNTGNDIWKNAPFWVSNTSLALGKWIFDFYVEEKGKKKELVDSLSINILGNTYDISGVYASSVMTEGIPTDKRYKYTNLEPLFIGFNINHLTGNGELHIYITSPTGEIYKKSMFYNTENMVWKNPPFNIFLEHLKKGTHTFEFFIKEDGKSEVEIDSFTIEINDKPK